MLSRRYRWLVPLACLLITLSYFLLQKNQRSYSNILLITIDALRPDHLGCYGYPRDTSPNIDKLAKEGVIFTQAIAQAPWTVPSIVSLLTSTYPYIHKTNDYGIPFPSDLISLPDILNTHGYITGCISNMSMFDGIPGLSEEFDTYLTNMTYQWQGFPSKLTKVTEITEEIKKWIEKNKNKNFFLWIHFWDTHSPPLNPPLPYFDIFLKDEYSEFIKEVPVSEDYMSGINGLPRYLAISNNNITDINYYVGVYDGAIRYVDNQVGLILRHLERLHLDKNTLIIINSDHGEAIGEHNVYFGHGFFLYDESIKVPLIVKYKNLPNKKIDIQVQSIDITPTILDILKIKKPSTMKGLSFLPLIYNKKDEYYNKLAFSYFASKDLYSIRMPQWKLIYDHKNKSIEFYNLQQDPSELKCIEFTHSNNKDIFYFLRNELEAQIKEANSKKESTKQPLDQETKKKLKNLGYLQ